MHRICSFRDSPKRYVHEKHKNTHWTLREKHPLNTHWIYSGNTRGIIGQATLFKLWILFENHNKFLTVYLTILHGRSVHFHMVYRDVIRNSQWNRLQEIQAACETHHKSDKHGKHIMRTIQHYHGITTEIISIPAYAISHITVHLEAS